MKKYLVFLLMTLMFWGCVEEVTLDTNEPKEKLPTPCFQETNEVCGTTIIPMPSDYMLAAVPSGTELNLPTNTPFTMSFSADIDETTLAEKVTVLKDGVPFANVVVSVHPVSKNILLISPESGEWEPASYSVILSKGIKSSDGNQFTESLAFYYGKSKASLLDEEKKSTIAVVDDATANALEPLRLSLVEPLKTLEDAGMDRATFLMLWSVTIKDNFMACFQSSDVAGCEQFNDAPIPSDFVMAYEADGSHHLDIPIDDSSSDTTKAMLTAINTLDGWGVTSPFMLNLSEELDETTITPQTVMVMQLTEGAPIPVPVSATWVASTRTLAISPIGGDIWRQKSQYAIVLTNGLKNTNGEMLIKSKIFSLAASKTTLLTQDGKSLYASAISDEDATTLEGLRLAMFPLFEGMANGGIPRENISMMYTVTTQTVTDDLMGLSLLLSTTDTLDSNPTITIPPVAHSQIPMALQQAGVSDPDVYAQDLGYTEAIDLYRNISYVVIGNLDLANYLSDTTGAWDPAKIPANPTVDTQRFFMTIPFVKDDMHPDYCEMPASGFPVVIFQHGLGGSKQQIFAMANKLAENCYVAIAIDAVKHGDRKEGMASGENFFSANLFASRDNLRQSVLDLVQLKTAINKMADPAFAVSELPSGVLLDGTKVSYFGISLGGILGTLFMTVSPDVITGVLNVPGGGLTNILMMTQSSDIKDPLINALADQGIVEGTPDFDQFLFLGQLILDQGDPIAYAHHTIKTPLGNEQFTYTAKNILMQKATDDEVINNYTTDHLSKVMGIYSEENTDNFKTYTPLGTYGSKHAFIGYNEAESEVAKDDVIDFYNAAFTGGN